MYHKLLAKQMLKSTSPSGEVDFSALLCLVSAAYEESDRDRRRTDRSLAQMILEIDARARDMEQQNALADVVRARLDLALQTMMHGICMFDADKRLVICNDRYAKMYQLPAELLKVGTPHSVIIEHRVSNGILKIETNTTSPEEKISSLAGLPHDAVSSRVDELSDGRLVSVVRVPMKGGGWVATHEDITGQRQAEVERARASVELAAIRARELAAIEANKAKSEFLAMMSHEIRTPMNAVIGLSSSLLDSKLDNEQQHVVNTIHESSNSLLCLLNDILDISKLEAGKVEFETIPFAPAAIINEMISILRDQGHREGVALYCHRSTRFAGRIARRSGPDPPGAAQSGQQCNQVHRERGLWRSRFAICPRTDETATIEYSVQ